MKVLFSDHFTRAFRDAPQIVQRDFGKQLGFILGNLRHPSLNAKKYDEARGLWQARVNLDWRCYFSIEDDTYHFHDIIPHPK